MKSLQKLCVAFVLTLALNFSVLAGDIHFPATDPPPPPPSASTEGDIQIPPASSVDSTVEIALSVLGSVLGLF